MLLGTPDYAVGIGDDGSPGFSSGGICGAGSGAAGSSGMSGLISGCWSGCGISEGLSGFIALPIIVYG
jgi:hypothetical protein